MWFVIYALAASPPDPQTDCDAGDTKACVALGASYLKGEGRPKDPFRAVQLFREACQAKDAHGCMYLAEAYRKGEGTGADVSQAMDYYTKACELGDGLACRSVGDLFVMGSLGRADGRTAGLWYRMACDLEDGQGCTAAALWVERGDDGNPDPKGAVSLFKQGCEYGDERGCTQLGIRYAKGASGLSRSHEDAAKWFEKACPLTGAADPEGCRELGWMQFKGKGIPENTTDGKMRLEMACYRNDHEGCRHLADVELDAGNAAEALLAAQRGCDLGDNASCRRVERAEFMLVR